jgi:hypothetical protein
VSLRTIICEKSSFQSVPGEFISNILKSIRIVDPFRITSGEELTMILNTLHGRKVKVSSLDIESMFFEIPRKTLLIIIRDKIESSEFMNSIEFQNKNKISPDDFIKLVSLYLSSTVLKEGEEYFRQEVGVPIGSKAAPVLSDLYMEYVDVEVKKELDGRGATNKIVKFVDDFLNLEVDEESVSVDDLKKVFTMKGGGLKFTTENACNGIIQFLDRKIHTNGGMCWEVSQRMEKPIIPFDSHMPSQIKKGNIINSIKRTMLGSCCHKMNEALDNIERRLRESGVPEQYLNNVYRTMNFIVSSKVEKENKKEKYVRPTMTMEYTHGFGNRLRNQMNEMKANLCFNHPQSYRNLPKKFAVAANRRISEDQICNHENMWFNQCVENVVYEIELSCGSKYIGETGRCVNTRANEHQKNIDDRTKKRAGDEGYSRISDHTNQCGCGINTTRILEDNLKTPTTRKLVESLYINDGVGVISSPSLNPTEGEIRFLKKNGKIKNFIFPANG